MQKCNIDCYSKCEQDVYVEEQCILHCKKNTYTIDWNSDLLFDFYNNFIDYIIEQLFEHKDLLNEQFTKEELLIYFKENKLDNEDYNKALKNTIFIPNCIHFPTRDGRDSFDYLKILNLFGQIHFNYCEFYMSDLDLDNVSCFFQDCKFHNRWTLYNYNILENEDNVIYQTCIFYKTVSNYAPEKSAELAVYKYSQFDYTCEFKDSMEFNRVKFDDMLFNTNQYNYLEKNIIKRLQFKMCTFENKFILNNYSIDDFICIDSIFNNKFEFKENKVNTFLINNSNFNNISDMYGCTFIKFNIKKSIFNDFAGFEKCLFGSINKLKEEVATFKYATFKDSLNLRNANFLSGLDIKNINLQGESNFLDSNIELKNTNRETFRSLKHSFDSIGNIIDANKYYHKEMQKREEELKSNLKNNFFEWIVFKVHDMSSKHSQDWILSLYWIVVVTFLYSHLKVFTCQENIEYYVIPLVINLIVFITIILEATYSKTITTSYKIFSIVIMYLIYSFITKDITLENFSNNINPFSIMTGYDTLNFSTLLYKITIAYLLYQLVISIRQNTRRK